MAAVLVFGTGCRLFACNVLEWTCSAEQRSADWWPICMLVEQHLADWWENRACWPSAARFEAELSAFGTPACSRKSLTSSVVMQVHARLAALYPEYDIAHMPADAIQGFPPDRELSQTLDPSKPRSACGPGPVEACSPRADAPCAPEALSNSTGSADLKGAPGQVGGAPGVRCAAFVGNAATAGDAFAYHVDADPAAFPDSPWRASFGDYANGAPGRPLLASLLLYLDAAWPRDWGAETLFLDGRTDVGVVVSSF